MPFVQDPFSYIAATQVPGACQCRSCTPSENAFQTSHRSHQQETRFSTCAHRIHATYTCSYFAPHEEGRRYKQPRTGFYETHENVSENRYTF